MEKPRPSTDIPPEITVSREKIVVAHCFMAMGMAKEIARDRQLKAQLKASKESTRLDNNIATLTGPTPPGVGV